MCLSVVFFALANVIVKQLGHLPFYELVFFRSAISVVMVGALLKQYNMSFVGTHKKLLLLRGLMGTCALTLFFYSLQNMPLASATSLQYMSPIFTVIIAQVFFGEKVKSIQWLYFFSAFVGVMIVKGFDPEITLFELAAILTSAFFSGIAYNIIKQLKGKEDPLTIVFYFPLVTTPVMIPFLLHHWVTPSFLDVSLLTLMAALTVCAQILMTKAYQSGAMSQISIFKYVGVLFAIAFGYFIFDESLSIMALLGIGVIICALVLNTRESLKAEASVEV